MDTARAMIADATVARCSSGARECSRDRIAEGELPSTVHHVDGAVHEVQVGRERCTRDEQVERGHWPRLHACAHAQRALGAALPLQDELPAILLVNGLAGSNPIDWLIMPSKEFARRAEEGVKWPLLCARAVIPPMIAAKRGRIVNVVSALGRYRSAYFRLNGTHSSEVITAASDSALLGLTRQLAFELAPHHIRVNAVTVGLIRSPDTEATWRKLSTRQQMFLLEEISLKRFGEPDEVAAAIEFLAGEASSYVTGTGIDVNGGWWMS